jgi:hypothetical protein
MYDLTDAASQYHRAHQILTHAYHLVDEAQMHVGRAGHGAMATKLGDVLRQIDSVRRQSEEQRTAWIAEQRKRIQDFRKATTEMRDAGTLEGSMPDVQPLGGE